MLCLPNRQGPFIYVWSASSIREGLTRKSGGRPVVASCICCPGKAQNLHHAIYQQHLVREGGSVTDPRNLVPVRTRCHMSHHDRSHPFELSMLPDSVFDFAGETLGFGAAYEYLSRYYRGGDDRLDALLTRHENEEISHGSVA